MNNPLLVTDVSWPMLVAAAIVLLGLSTWPRYRDLVRKGMVATSEGDYAGSIEWGLRQRQSHNPWAILGRWRNPGLIETALAGAHHALGELKESLDWCEKGLRLARKPEIKCRLHLIAALARAERGELDRMDEHLSVLTGLAQPQELARFHSTATLACNRLAGRIEQAMHVMRGHAGGLELPPGAKLADDVLPVLLASGRFDTVLRISNAWLHENPSVPDAASPTPLEASLGVDRLRRFLRSHERVMYLTWAFEAARTAERWDEFERLLPQLDVLESALPTVHYLQLATRVLWAAHCGRREELESDLEELEHLVASQVRNLRLRSAQCGLRATAWQLVGDHEKAVEAYWAQMDCCPAPVEESAAAAEVAYSLEALGRFDQANAEREKARRLAPAGFWNRPRDERSLPHEELLSSPPARGAPVLSTEAYLAPATSCEPVASRLAGAAWILACISMTPLIGAVPAIALAIVSLILLCRRRTFLQDRRVGCAGFICALLSFGFSATILAHRIVARSEAEAEMVAWAFEIETARSNGIEEERFGDEEDVELLAEGAEDELTLNEPGEELESPDDEDAVGGRSTLPLRHHAVYLAVLIVSIVFHEVGHAVAALWAGDPTARDMGRITLNPLRHLSWIGSFIVPAVLSVLPGGVIVGWAKPVPVRPDRFRRRRLGDLGVTLAGVSLNLLIAFLAANVLTILAIAFARLYPDAPIPELVHPLKTWVSPDVPGSAIWETIIDMAKATVMVNCLLFGFNLIPAPPLDGYGVVKNLLPSRLAAWLNKVGGVGTVLVLCLVAFQLLHWLLLPAVFAAVFLLTFARAFAYGF